MSDKDRRKKDGKDTGKDRTAMREGREFTSRQAHSEKPDTHDEQDVIKHKPGSPSDRSRTGAP